MSNEITIPEPLQKQVGPLAQRYADEREALFKLTDDLKAREMSPMTVALAVETDTRAKAFGEQVTSAFEPMVTVAFKTHKALTTIRGKIVEPVAVLRNLCGRIISDYKLAELKKLQETPAPAERSEITERTDQVLSGVSMTPAWRAIESDIDLLKLARHIVEHPELAFLLPTADKWTGDINRYAGRMMKGKIGNPGEAVEFLPGVKIECSMVKGNRNRDE